MIESLYDNPIDVGYTEGDQLSSELLRTIEPYSNEDILTIDGDVMVRWLYNLMYIARRVDLGLAHSIQHNHIAKNYVMMASGSALKDKINNSAYHETIGAHATLKPSDNITMQDNVLNGSKHWLTNLTVANYVALNIIEPYKNHTSSKVIFDLDKTPHTIYDSYDGIIGMKSAKPSTVIVDNYKIPKNDVLGGDKTSNRSFFEECSFFTNLIGAMISLFDEVYQFTKDNDCSRDYNVIKVKLDVFTSVNIWINRMEQISNNIDDKTSEDWWVKKEFHYLFAKKSLVSVINLSRELCIQSHLVSNGESSRVYRNAVTFASHMRRFDQLENLWDRPEDKEINFDSFINDNVERICN